VCYMPCLSQSRCLDQFNYIWRRVQLMKLLIIQYSPTSYYFIPLQFRYFQHSVLRYL
jgi:hypothetical protein